MDELTKRTVREIEAEIDKRLEDKVIEEANADLLKKLLRKAESPTEALAIAALGTTYKRTGFHFDKRLEKVTNTIRHLKKNDTLSFTQDENALTHTLVIGDNYPALLNLLVQYREKVDVIYIDPPYGKDDMGAFAATNYNNALTRDNLLSMLYPRLRLAKQLLSETGVIFCSIDDKNQAYVKGLFDEVFGEGNCIGDIIRKTKSQTNDAKNGLNYQHEFVLVYAKNKDEAFLTGDIKDTSNYKNPDDDPNGVYVLADPSARSGTESGRFEIRNPYTGTVDLPPQGRYWAFSKSTFNKWLESGKLVFREEVKEGQRGFIVKKYLNEVRSEYKLLDSLFGDDNNYMNQVATKELNDMFSDKEKAFDYPKPTSFIYKLIASACSTNKDALILDFFAGSGTTGQAVLELNKADGGKRKFILVTNNEKTETTPAGIAYDVTSKRLKRVMTGSCYDGSSSFKWLEKNKPLGGNLLVLDVATQEEGAKVCSLKEGERLYDKIDERLYGKEKMGLQEKIEWLAANFENVAKALDEGWF